VSGINITRKYLLGAERLMNYPKTLTVQRGVNGW